MTTECTFFLILFLHFDLKTIDDAAGVINVLIGSQGKTAVLLKFVFNDSTQWTFLVEQR